MFQKWFTSLPEQPSGSSGVPVLADTDDRPLSPATRELVLEELEELRKEYRQALEAAGTNVAIKYNRAGVYARELKPFLSTLPTFDK